MTLSATGMARLVGDACGVPLPEFDTVTVRGARALVRRGGGFSPWDDARPCAYAIGAFDGVHLGHRRLVGSCVDQAREAGVASCAVLFDPDPASVLAPAGAET